MSDAPGGSETGSHHNPRGEAAPVAIRRADAPRTRADFHAASGVLLVVRDTPPAPPATAGQPPSVSGDPAEGPEILLAVWDDGNVTALSGHVDLGPGCVPRWRKSWPKNSTSRWIG